MSNIHRGEVEIVLDKPRKIKFTTNSLAELENKLGFSISEIGEKNTLFIQSLIKCLWAGLIEYNPDLTLKDVANLMDHAEGYDYIAEKVKQALEIKFSTKKNYQKKTHQRQRNSNGNA